MREVMLEIDTYRVHTTGCTQCGGVWIDRGDLVRIRPHLPKPAVASDERIEALELRVAEAQREADEARAAQAEEQAPWRKRIWVMQLLPLLLAQTVVALPLEVYSPVRTRPWATYALILANVLIFLGEWFSPYVSIEALGLVPAVFLAREAPWTIFTSMFLHGSLLHLLGNMYFLRVFGDNVEDRLGIPEYLTLYFLGGVAAGLAHIASDPGSAEPLIGASGAVSAVMGAYVYLFPHRKLYMMFVVFLRRIRAVWYLAVWLALQFIYAAMGIPGVAWWAHIGGFALGIAAAALHRSVLRRRLAQSEAMSAAA
jgi:membrane associated rhomboid family serine protease